LRKPDAIIFDLDGTLVDSAPDIRCALNAVLAQNALPGLELEVVKLMIGGGPDILISRALDKLGINAVTDEVRRLRTSFEVAYSTQGHSLSCLFPGAVSCLERLENECVAIGLCSNKPEHICRRLLADLGVRQFFDVIQGSGSGLPTKPHPAGLIAALRRLGVSAEQALYVGDSQTDVDTARAAGLPVALVRGGYTAVPADSLGADWVLEGLVGIPSIWQ
jgi:phosphoglycolate phosphatase